MLLQLLTPNALKSSPYAASESLARSDGKKSSGPRILGATRRRERTDWKGMCTGMNLQQLINMECICCCCDEDDEVESGRGGGRFLSHAEQGFCWNRPHTDDYMMRCSGDDPEMVA